MLQYPNILLQYPNILLQYPNRQPEKKAILRSFSLLSRYWGQQRFKCAIANNSTFKAMSPMVRLNLTPISGRGI
ncbi:hypothetical protein [Nostoc sp.]